MENKKCTRCKEIKLVNEFYVRRERGLNEYRPKCKKCCSEIQKQNKEKRIFYTKKSYEKHKEKRVLQAKEYRKNNPEKVKETEIKSRIKHKEKRIIYSVEYTKKRRKTDLIFNFRHKISNNILASFKKNNLKKPLKSEEILGCTISFFKEYISFQFKKGMSFENFGKWHLDHIKPLSTAKNEQDVINLCHYTNYQPLWKKENLQKSNKITNKQLKLL